MNFTPLALVVLGLVIAARLAAFIKPSLVPAFLAARRRPTGREGRHRDIDLLSAVAKGTGETGDERTWRDLDLDDVFHSVDYAESEIGRQCLYARLRRPAMDKNELEAFGARVRAVGADARVAERIRAAASMLSDKRAAFLVDLIFGELPARPMLWWLFPILTALAFGSLIAMPIWPRAFLVLVAVACVNVVTQVVFKPRMKRFVPAIHELPAFLRAAEQLADLGQPELRALATTVGTARHFRSVKRAAWWLMFEPGQSNELATSVYEYLNLVLLLDITAFAFTTERIRSTQRELQRIFFALGELDVLQSVHAWRESMRTWCTPTFLPRQQGLDVDAIFHPLLETPVANSIQVSDVGVLVTGSNMSGKTTFIRTLGVNCVLAQTLFTVCAERWSAPLLVTRTSIGRADSIMEGKSYYLAEAESVRSLLLAKQSGEQHLFLLDEIFRGTNTSERIAAAYAVLRFLVKGDDLVFVATHDLELLAMLGDGFVGYHFAEQVSDDALSFDYRIRDGLSSTRNAIALLQLMQYPSEVVANALSVVESLGVTTAMIVEGGAEE